jgi:membrane protein implicated in regulation of membrane protease activity
MQEGVRMLDFDPWHFWVIIALVCFIAEIFLPGFVLASIGVGALVAAAIHQFTGDLNWGIGGWIVGASIAFIFIRPVVIRTISSDEPSGFGASGMIGDVVIVSDSEDVGGNPKTRYRDSSWILESENDLIEGDHVKIVDVRGSTLIVKKENQS